jgi:hypothetical protein
MASEQLVQMGQAGTQIRQGLVFYIVAGIGSGRYGVHAILLVLIFIWAPSLAKSGVSDGLTARRRRVKTGYIMTMDGVVVHCVPCHNAYQQSDYV